MTRIVKRKSNKRAEFKRKDAKLREAMLDAYLHKQSINYVSIQCQVSRKTVRDYRDADGWDAAVEKMNKRIARKVVTKNVNRTARNVKALDTAIDNAVKQMTRKKKNKTDVPIMILPQLIKTQDELIRRNPEMQDQEEMSPEVTEAIKVLSAMDKKGVAALGDMLIADIEKESRKK